MHLASGLYCFAAYRLTEGVGRLARLPLAIVSAIVADRDVVQFRDGFGVDGVVSLTKVSDRTSGDFVPTVGFGAGAPVALLTVVAMVGHSAVASATFSVSLRFPGVVSSSTRYLPISAYW